MKYEEEKICTSLKDLKTDEKIVITRDDSGNITEIEKRKKSDCYVITACYGKSSKQLNQVKNNCKTLFVKNVFMFPFWVLYKYVIGEELAYLYFNGIFEQFIKTQIAEKILEYTKTKSFILKLHLIILGLLSFSMLPFFLIVKLIRISNHTLVSKI